LLSPMSYALQRGILLRRENPTYMYWAPVVAATRGLMVLFTASLGNNFVGGTCAPPSALLVDIDIEIDIHWLYKNECLIGAFLRGV